MISPTSIHIKVARYAIAEHQLASILHHFPERFLAYLIVGARLHWPCEELPSYAPPPNPIEAWGRAFREAMKGASITALDVQRAIESLDLINVPPRGRFVQYFILTDPRHPEAPEEPVMAHSKGPPHTRYRINGGIVRILVGVLRSARLEGCDLPTEVQDAVRPYLQEHIARHLDRVLRYVGHDEPTPEARAQEEHKEYGPPTVTTSADSNRVYLTISTLPGRITLTRDATHKLAMDLAESWGESQRLADARSAKEAKSPAMAAILGTSPMASEPEGEP